MILHNDKIKSTNPKCTLPTIPIKLGRAISISERARWIRLPNHPSDGMNTNDSTFTISWFPGILYESYTELMRDVDPSLPESSIFLANVLKLHLRTPKPVPPIAIILGFNKPIIRTLPNLTKTSSYFGTLSNEVDVKCFYTYYEEMYESVMNLSSSSGQNCSKHQQEQTKDFLFRAVDTLTQLLLKEEDERSPLESAFIPIISPPPLMMDEKIIQEHHHHNYEPSIIATDKTATLKRARDDKSHCQNNNHSSKNTDRVLIHTSSTRREKKRPKKSNSLLVQQQQQQQQRTKKSQNTASSSSTHADIQPPNAPWNSAWNQMRKSLGWTWKPGNGLVDYYYIKPNVKDIKTALLGVDYFDNELDVQHYAKTHYGWIDSTQFDEEEASLQDESCMDDESISDKNSETDDESIGSQYGSGNFDINKLHDHLISKPESSYLDPCIKKQLFSDRDDVNESRNNNMIDASSKRGKKVSNDEFHPTSSSSVQADIQPPNAPWNSAWNQMRKSLGWKWKPGNGLVDYLYIKPNVKDFKTALLGVDYFDNELDVQHYAKTHYGWIDPDSNNAAENEEDDESFYSSNGYAHQMGPHKIQED